jgi:hypothetical protein
VKELNKKMFSVIRAKNRRMSETNISAGYQKKGRKVEREKERERERDAGAANSRFPLSCEAVSTGSP